MAGTEFVAQFSKICAVTAFMTVLTACGGGGSEVGPPSVQPASLAIGGVPSAAMLSGKSTQLTATLTYSDSSRKDVTATASWSTSNAAVLSVSSSGTVLAVAPGQAEVTASAEGVSSRGSVRVEQPVPRLALLAGSLGGSGHVDGIGPAARFNLPTGIASDSAGNVYIADTWNSIIRRISTNGTVSTLAGMPGLLGSADGPAAEARFNGPLGVAVDESGNVYVADTGNHSIRKITPAGVVSTVAGQQAWRRH
jgi:hypothetical protein